MGPALHVSGATQPFDGLQFCGVGVGQHIHRVDPELSSCCRPNGAPQFSLLQGDIQPRIWPLLTMRRSTDLSPTVWPRTLTDVKFPPAVRSSPLGHFWTSSVDASTPLNPHWLPMQSHPEVSPTGVSLYGMVQPSTWLVSNHVVGFCQICQYDRSDG